MIEFTREDAKVVIKVDTGCEAKIITRWNCDSELFARLLTERLQQELKDRMEAIRRNAYEQGWKDKSSKKKRKNTHHSSSTKTDYFGYSVTHK